MSVNKQKSQHEKNNKMNEIDHGILKNFEIKKRLGKGAYGIVWQAVDKKTTQIVAVKKIFDAFRNETDAQRTFREIMFLRAFRNHPNIIQLHSIHKACNNMDIYLSFEYMESDLHNVIKRGSILKDVHKRFVMYQLFNAIAYIHSGNVIHRDMKPSNVLVDTQCRCKIADFGLARSLSTIQMSTVQGHYIGPCLTEYVATRWYRAPEILVASKKYTKGIDMWSLGCILGEMIRGKPLFPGTCTVNQMERITSALPEATKNDINSIGAGFGSVLLNNPGQSKTNPNLDELLSGSPSDAKQLVKSLLVLSPMNRLTAKQALQHKYIEKFRNTMVEEELNADILPPFRDDVQLSVSEYRSKLYEIMATNEKNGYTSLKHMDKRTLQSSLTVKSYPNPKKSIFTQSADVSTSEERLYQNIGDCKYNSQTLPKTKPSFAPQSSTHNINHSSRSSVIDSKHIKAYIKLHRKNTQNDVGNHVNNNINNNNNNNAHKANPNNPLNGKGPKTTPTNIHEEVKITDDRNLKSHFHRTKHKTINFLSEKSSIAPDRRRSMDSALCGTTKKLVTRASSSNDRRPSVDLDPAAAPTAAKVKPTESTTKIVPTMSKYKIIKQLQKNQEKTVVCPIRSNHIANKDVVEPTAKVQSIGTKLLNRLNRSQSEDYSELKLKNVEERNRQQKPNAASGSKTLLTMTPTTNNNYSWNNDFALRRKNVSSNLAAQQMKQLACILDKDRKIRLNTGETVNRQIANGTNGADAGAQQTRNSQHDSNYYTMSNNSHNSNIHSNNNGHCNGITNYGSSQNSYNDCIMTESDFQKIRT